MFLTNRADARRLRLSSAPFLASISLLALPASAQPDDGAQPAGEAQSLEGTQAEEASLVSGDNPGLTNVTSAAPQFTLITEQMVSASFGTTPQVTVPGLLVRFGLLKWLEVRAYAPSLVLTFPRSGATQTATDELGLGAVLAAQLAPRVSGSLVPVVVLPVGDAGAPGVEGHLQANIAWDVSDQWSLQAAARVGLVQEQVTGTDEPPDAPLDVVTDVSFRGGVLVQYSPIRTLALFAQSYVDILGVGTLMAGGGATLWIAPSVALFAEANAGVYEGPSMPPPLSASAGAVVRWW